MKNSDPKVQNWLKRFFPAIILLVIIFVSARKFFFSPGYILYGEFFGSSDYFFFLKDLLKGWTDYTTLGHSNIGFPTVYGLNPAFFIIPPALELIYVFFMVILQFVFGSFALKVLIIISLTLPYLGMYYFFKYWAKNVSHSETNIAFASSLSGLIYSINPVMGDRISAGHLKYNLAYGLLPLLLLFSFKSIEEKDSRLQKMFLLSSGLIFSIIFQIMPHLITFYAIILGLYFILFVIPNKQKIISFFIVSFITFVLGILLNFNAWLPTLFYKENYPLITDFYYSLNWVYAFAKQATFKNVISIASALEQQLLEPTIYKNIIQFKLLLPFLVLTSLLIIKPRRKSVFSLFFIILGVILAMGINYPFEKVYSFLYQNVFLFKPFRDVSKFLILYIFGFSISVPYLIFVLSKFGHKAIVGFFVIIVCYLFYTNPNFTTGNFGNTIDPINIPSKYQQLNQFLSDNEAYRVAMYPNQGTVGDYSWSPKLLSGSVYFNPYQLLIPLKKSLAISNRTISDLSSRYLDFIESNLDQSWATDRLGQEKVRYLIVDQSNPYYEETLKKLKKNPSLKSVNSVAGFSTFEIKNFNQQEIQSKSSVYYFGDIGGIKYLPPDLALIDLGLNSTDILSSNLSSNIVLYNSDLNDVFLNSLQKYQLSFLPEVRFGKDTSKSFFMPGEYLRDLTKLGIRFYNEVQIESSIDSKISKKTKLSSGQYRVFMKVLSYDTHTNGARITLDNQTLDRKIGKKKPDTFAWVDFGTINVKNTDPTITLKNLEKKPLLVDYLVIIPESQYNKEKDNFNKLISSKTVIKLDKPLTKFEERQKSIAVLPQSYSPYWKICGQKPFLVNFYATAANCSGESDIKAQFSPALFYELSDFVSIVSHFAILGLIILISRVNKKTTSFTRYD